jgi:hypothetical protein
MSKLINYQQLNDLQNPINSKSWFKSLKRLFLTAMGLIGFCIFIITPQYFWSKLKQFFFQLKNDFLNIIGYKDKNEENEELQQQIETSLKTQLKDI